MCSSESRFIAQGVTRSEVDVRFETVADFKLKVHLSASSRRQKLPRRNEKRRFFSSVSNAPLGVESTILSPPVLQWGHCK